MSLPMSSWGALALAAVVLLAGVRVGRRPLWWALQALAAMALWAALWPPLVSRPAATLVVAAAGASPSEWSAHRHDGPLVALPGAPALPGAQAVPDLATALRRTPQAGRVRVIGDGLPARDREALGARALSFDPPPPPAGLVELQAAVRSTVATPWRVHGRVIGPAGARVQLRDPGGRVVAQAPVGTDGRFTLVTRPPSIGRVEYHLRVRDAQGRERDAARLPLEVVAGRQPRVWMLAGGPDAEQKNLRRWAEDAGFAVRSRAALGAGLAVGDAVPMDAAALREADVLVLDQRAWRALGPGARAGVREAVAQGLGLVLRLQEAPSAAERALLREFGWTLEAAAPSTTVRLPGARAPFAGEEVVEVVRAPVAASADDARMLVADAAGAPLARWRALGRGRIGAWWLDDSYRLRLAGQPGLHARLWAQALSTLARADQDPPPRLRSPLSWANQRSVVCGLDAAPARVQDPEGRSVPLQVDAWGCAAWWPTQVGWHRIEAGTRTLDWPVREPAELPGVQAWERRQATHQLRRTQAQGQGGSVRTPGPRWPFFLAWLALQSLVWWRERPRRPVD